jgi:putative DNA primase/helicase
MTRGLLDHDPSIFNLHASPFPYDPKAQCPVFDRFLSETFAGDQESIDTHLRWMAYELSGRGDLQKGYFLLGPTRSGKGTLSHISDALLGLSQVTAMSLRDFGTDFGMAALVGKSVCRINDARDAGTATGAAVERLLGIIGGDHVQINRKNKDAWVGQLGVRFTIASNEELRLPDASGAIINRFIFNRTETSHLGREDTTLLGRILEREMPGVLNRVLDHIDRLDEEWPKNDRVMETISSMRAAASPITAWIQDRGLLVGSVLVGYRYSMPKGEAFSEYSSWAYENGYQRMNSATFGRHLRAAIPLGKDTFPGPKGKQVPHYTGIGTMEEGCRCSACMG